MFTAVKADSQRTVPMLTVDVIVNLFLTSGFVYPVFKAGFTQAKSLAKSSCIAAGVALATSFANILVLSILHGHEAAYICLGCCLGDGQSSPSLLPGIASQLTSSSPQSRSTLAYCMP